MERPGEKEEKKIVKWVGRGVLAAASLILLDAYIDSEISQQTDEIVETVQEGIQEVDFEDLGGRLGDGFTNKVKESAGEYGHKAGVGFVEGAENELGDKLHIWLEILGASGEIPTRR